MTYYTNCCVSNIDIPIRLEVDVSYTDEGIGTYQWGSSKEVHHDWTWTVELERMAVVGDLSAIVKAERFWIRWPARRKKRRKLARQLVRMCEDRLAEAALVVFEHERPDIISQAEHEMKDRA